MAKIATKHGIVTTEAIQKRENFKSRYDKLNIENKLLRARIVELTKIIRLLEDDKKRWLRAKVPDHPFWS